MANLAAYLPVDGAPAIAAQCAKVSDVIPGFLDENPLPALPGVVPNFWLGNALTVPVHHDHPYNLACVVAGRRRPGGLLERQRCRSGRANISTDHRKRVDHHRQRGG